MKTIKWKSQHFEGSMSFDNEKKALKRLNELKKLQNKLIKQGIANNLKITIE